MISEEADLYRPFIAQDGLEYGSVAAFLCSRPLDTWRNRRIQDHRQAGRSEEALQQWIKGYDGDDPRTTGELAHDEAAREEAGSGRTESEISKRQRRAWFSVDDFDAACTLTPDPSASSTFC